MGIRLDPASDDCRLFNYVRDCGLGLSLLRVEERRIGVAIDALALVYESKFVFQAIRARGIRHYEYEGGSQGEWEDDDSPAQIRIAQREGQRGAYAVLKRIEAQEEFFEKVYKLEPLFMAVFGAKSDEIFSRLYSAKVQIETAAQELFDDERVEHDPEDEGGQKRRHDLRELIFRSTGEQKGKDQVGDLLDDFRNKIEAICRPVVETQYGRRQNSRLLD